MINSVRALTVSGLLLMLGASAGLAQEPKPSGVVGQPPADARGRELLERKLATLNGADRGRILPVTDASVAHVFPEHLFYVLRFPQYPVALAPPAQLGPSNLFVVKPDGSVDHIVETKALEVFFRSTLTPIKTEAEARDAAKAWLRLATEFQQDGFFQFSIPDDAIAVARTGGGAQEVTGKAVVDPRGGNQGEIVASLTFDPAGGLAHVAQMVSLKRGIRPICQATKLLDPDPIVRGMAEQAILVMGKAAEEYLNEVRADANPELWRAIDRIWQRILSEDR